MQRTFVAVGANLDPEAHIVRALDLLCAAVSVQASSTFYRTRPLARVDQPDYVNGVWCVDTDLDARELKFSVLRRIEATLGRVRGEDTYASRPIDLDVILQGDTVVVAPDLQLPDPDIRSRPFIAVPLLELAPDLRLPDDGAPLSGLPVLKTMAGMDPMPGFTRALREKIRQLRF